MRVREMGAGGRGVATARDAKVQDWSSLAIRGSLQISGARALTCWEATAKDEAVSRARRAMPLPAALRSAAMFSHPRPEHAKDCDVGGRAKTKKVKSGFTDSFEK